MPYDFDRVIERRATASNKWRKYPADVLPLWVADMDFASPEPVVRALRERVEHGVYGYGFEEPEFAQVFVDRLQKRYGWTVSPEAVVMIPGVIPAFNVACRTLTKPGDGLLMQVPVYPPILRSPGNHELTRDEAPLGPGPRRPLRGGPRRVQQGHSRAHPRVPALQPAQSGRARVHAGRASRRWPRPAWSAICRSSPTRSTATCVYQGQRHIPIASLGPEIERRTITLMAPSKTFNLAGLKVSVAVIPNASLRERFVAARGDYVQAQVNVSAMPRPSPRTATATRGSASCCAISRPTGTTWPTTWAGTCPASR